MIFTSQLGMLDGKTEKEAIASIANHLRRMQEELEYRLCVLDSSNITEIDARNTSIITPEGNLLSVIKDGGKYAELMQTVDGFRTTVSNYEETVSGYKEQVSTFNQTAEGFRATVSNYTVAVNGYEQQVSSFNQSASEISAKVYKVVDQNTGEIKAASIVAAINQTTGDSLVKIKADHIEMTGNVQFLSASDLGKDGSVTVDAGRISASGVIEGWSLSGAWIETKPTKNGAYVTISGSGIQFSHVGYISEMYDEYGNRAMYIDSNELVLCSNSAVSIYPEKYKNDGYWLFYANSLIHVNSYGERHVVVGPFS